MTISFTVSATIPASPEDIYAAWLDSRKHARMTGGSKATMSQKVGAAVSAWDGYITGKNLELVPGKKIVQSWRSSEFADTDPDSKITVTLKPAKSGTKVTIRHTRLPDGQDGVRDGGWQDNYFVPMAQYFLAKD